MNRLYLWEHPPLEALSPSELDAMLLEFIHQCSGFPATTRDVAILETMLHASMAAPSARHDRLSVGLAYFRSKSPVRIRQCPT